MKDINTFTSDLQKALAKIGRTNGLAPRDSQDPANKLLHYYLVDTIAESFFKKQREVSLGLLLETVDQTKVAKAIKDTVDGGMGVSAKLISSEDYQLDLSTKQGASKTDMTIFKNQLAKLGVKADIIEAAEKAAKGRNAPAKSFTVTVIGE